MVKINLDDFIKAHRISAIPDYILEMETDLLLEDKDFTNVEVPDSLFEEVAAKEKDEELQEHEYEETSVARLRGTDFEKKDDIKQAIESFKQCIQIGRSATHDMQHAYFYAYERLIIDLHKVKDFQEEEFYIRQFLEELTPKEEKNKQKYTERLNKLIARKS